MLARIKKNLKVIIPVIILFISFMALIGYVIENVKYSDMLLKDLPEYKSTLKKIERGIGAGRRAYFKVEFVHNGKQESFAIEAGPITVAGSEDDYENIVGIKRKKVSEPVIVYKILDSDHKKNFFVSANKGFYVKEIWIPEKYKINVI